MEKIKQKYSRKCSFTLCSAALKIIPINWICLVFRVSCENKRIVIARALYNYKIN